MEYQLTAALRLVLAAILGGLIGLERESLNKSAGFRTHTLVSLGSCLIMILSIEMYTVVGQGEVGDPARLAAQVVSGIGFLGAGTIMRSGLGIRGLTTAASLWVVAGIGLSVGAGSYFISVIATIIVILVLVYMPRIEGVVKKASRTDKEIEVYIDDKPGQLGLVSTALGQMNIHIRKVEMSEPLKDSQLRLTFWVIIPYNLTEKEIIEGLQKLQGVGRLSVTAG